LLRNGVNTFVEFGSQGSVPEALQKEVGHMGTRAYLGLGYDCGRWVGDVKGRLKRIADNQRGEQDLEAALDFIDRHDGSAEGRVNGLLVPREVDTCSVDLLRKTREIADERGFPIATHAAYSVIEFQAIVAEHQMTPIELLASLNLLRPTLNIGHGSFIFYNPNLNYSMAHDLDLMG